MRSLEQLFLFGRQFTSQAVQNDAMLLLLSK
jgi:hypothetical protein